MNRIKAKYCKVHSLEIQHQNHIRKADPESAKKRKEYKAQYYQDNKERIQEQRKKNPISSEKRSHYQYTYIYGIGLETFQSLCIQQNNKCSICGCTMEKNDPKTRPVLDHNHISGELRAVLCHVCNIGLGCFKDDLEVLKQAVSYMEKHSGQTSSNNSTNQSPNINS